MTIQLVAVAAFHSGPPGSSVAALVDEFFKERVYHRHVGENKGHEGFSDGPVARLRRILVADLLCCQ